MKKIFLFLTLIILLNAEEIKKEDFEQKVLTYNWLSTLEKGTKRDFYINEYLQKDISSEDSLLVLSLVDNLNNEMFFNFAKSFKHDETFAVAQCMNMDTKELIHSYADCIVSGLSLKDATTLSSIDIDLIIQKTKDKYPSFVKNLKVISSAIPFTKLIISKKEDFYNIYLNVNSDFRVKYFNYKLPKRTFTKIFEDKKKFDIFLSISLTNPKLNKIHKSLLDIDDTLLNDNSSFLLALNAYKFNDLNLAYKFIQNASSKTKNKNILDKYLFWEYTITKNEELLEKLSNSITLNLYSTLANELLEKPLEDYNFLESFDSFNLYSEKYDHSRVATLYSIAKNKSNFKSDFISEDFEVGIMQLNPSLIKTISNNVDKNYDIFAQENIEISLEFANIHLNTLENSYKHPLYLTLAYEGKSNLLNFKNKYELFKENDLNKILLDLEYLNNLSDEDLGKYILYYYYFYNKVEKEKIKLSILIQSLQAQVLK